MLSILHEEGLESETPLKTKSQCLLADTCWQIDTKRTNKQTNKKPVTTTKNKQKQTNKQTKPKQEQTNEHMDKQPNTQ